MPFGEDGPVVDVSGEEVEFAMVTVDLFELNPRPMFFDLSEFSIELAIVDIGGCSDSDIRGTKIELVEDVMESGAWGWVLDEVGDDVDFGGWVSFEEGEEVFVEVVVVEDGGIEGGVEVHRLIQQIRTLYSCATRSRIYPRRGYGF